MWRYAIAGHRQELIGNNEVPPVNTTATGVANFTLSPDGKSLHYILSAHDISGVMGAHIHVGHQLRMDQFYLPYSILACQVPRLQIMEYLRQAP